MWFEDAITDLRQAARSYRKAPLFTLTAAATLALGIAGGTAVFSVVNAVLLRALPYRDPGRLVMVLDRGVRESSLAKIFATSDDFDEYRRHARSFESVSAATWAVPGRVWTGAGPARGVMAELVSANFFDSLGAHASLGRTFGRDDESSACSLVLSDRFWRTRLQADRRIIGKALTLDDHACTMVGVMPAQFAFYPEAAQMWMLSHERPIVVVVARLRPGVTREQAQAELTALHAALHRADGRERDIAPLVDPLQDDFTWLASRDLKSTLLMLSGAVTCLLLIACLNVANLLLGRSLGRRRELAVRAALGSGRGRIVRQLMVEALLLAAFGGCLGVAGAFGIVNAFDKLNPVELPVGAVIALDAPVLSFSAGLSIAVALVFGIMPAWRASRVDVNEALKSGGRSSTGFGISRATARLLIGAEVALTVILLAGAGLLMGTVLRMQSESLGFDPASLVTARLDLPAKKYASEADRGLAYDELLRRLQTTPGVPGVALSSSVPPFGGGNQILEIEGRAKPKAVEVHDAGGQAVSATYFDVMGTPLLAGRAFDSRDRLESEPVAIVNQALAREYFSDSNPIGRRVRLGDGQNATPWLTIVGIVAGQKHTTIVREMSWVDSPIVYRPVAQEPRPSMSVVARIASRSQAAHTVAEVMSRFDPEAPTSDVESINARLQKPLAYPRFRALVLAGFGVCALLLAAVGLNGVLSQFVSQRTREFGLRMAVGARARDVFALIARQGGAPVAVGLALGLGIVLAAKPVIAALLYGTAHLGVLAGIAVLLAIVAAIAISAPAARAATTDPMEALRDE